MPHALKNILLVTNSTKEDEIKLVKETLVEYEKKGLFVKVNLVHVIPNLPTCYFNIPSMVMLAEQYYEEAKKCLSAAGEALSIHRKDQWLITGRVTTEVLRLASKLGSHFILASSTNIQDLHKVFADNRRLFSTQIKSITNLAANF